MVNYGILWVTMINYGASLIFFANSQIPLKLRHGMKGWILNHLDWLHTAPVQRPFHKSRLVYEDVRIFRWESHLPNSTPKEVPRWEQTDKQRQIQLVQSVAPTSFWGSWSPVGGVGAAWCHCQFWPSRQIKIEHQRS